MELSLKKDELKKYVGFQLEHFFPDGAKFRGRGVDSAFELALERLEYSFKHIAVPAYCNKDRSQTFFSHLHGDQYAQFLYYFANSLWNLSQNKAICDKLIYLNRVLNNFFVSYKCKLPDIFWLVHPVGSIIGNACYNNFLVILQNVTINTGGEKEGDEKPVIGKGVLFATGATLIGNKSVGAYSSLGANVTVYNKEIPPNSLVFRNDVGEIVIKNNKDKAGTAQQFFNVPIR